MRMLSNNTNSFLEGFEHTASLGFGESICEHVFGWTIGQGNIPRLNPFSDVVVPDMDMLGAVMVNWISDEGKGSLVIPKENSWRILRKSHVIQQLA